MNKEKISIANAIALIQHQNCRGYNDEQKCKWAGEGFGKCEDCAYYKAIQAMKRVDDGDNVWIPVEERLPQPYQRILVTREKFHWANEPAEYEVAPVAFNGSVDFVAWRPVPEPYKKEEEE